MLRDTGDRVGMFTYGGGGVGTYTASAQAIDHRQRLVNTYLEGFEPFKVENVTMPLYVLAKRKSYLLDSKQYSGRQDVWQSSRQAFFYPRGGCEDHAIVLADWLIEMGEDARVATGLMNDGGHAWVILFKDGKEWLLEATQKSGLSRTRAYPLRLCIQDTILNICSTASTFGRISAQNSPPNILVKNGRRVGLAISPKFELRILTFNSV